MKILKIVLCLVLGIGVIVGGMFLVRAHKLEEQLDSLYLKNHKLELENHALKKQLGYEKESQSAKGCNVIGQIDIDSTSNFAIINIVDTKEVSKTYDKIKNDILAELSKINPNQKKDAIASQAREIVIKKIDSLNKTHKKWFKKNVIDNRDDDAVAGIVRKIMLGWEPFTPIN